MANDISLHKQQASELSTKLWAIANDLRGTMDASKFKDYILGIIFYRYLSERTENYMREILKNDGLSYEEVLKSHDDELLKLLDGYSLDGLGYIIKPEYGFHYVVDMIAGKYVDTPFSVDYLEKAIASIQQSTLGQKSESTFEGIFDAMDLKDKDLGKEVSDRTRQIAKVINRVNDIAFTYDDAQFDVLGTAYMILIGLFASDSGKKGGEFFTPSAASELCSKLATVGLSSVKSVCDPTCGSASMLLEVRKAVIANGGTEEHAVGHYYGQELNGTTYNLARMNMLMHAVPYQYFNLYNDDTLEKDNFNDLKFTVQVANPPYSAKWSASSKFLDDARFSGAGRLAPSSKADFAFVEHMVYHMDDDGRVAVLLPHGVLFRGGSEKAIREYLIRDTNVLDAVIGLPANLFHGTSIPVCCLVFKKNRNGNSKNICFIDASKFFTPGKNMNQLAAEDIERILNAYKERKDIEKFCHIADINDEIEKENNFNLNIPRYVDTFEEEEEIDIKAVMAEIKQLESQRAGLDVEINKYLKELGILED